MDTCSPFDAVDYLDRDETIAEYLTAALEDEHPDVFLIALAAVARALAAVARALAAVARALAAVARARGMTAVAQSTGWGWASLYNALTPRAKPRSDTILKVLHGLGVRLTVTTEQ